MHRPNIVFILIDDLGWRDLSSYGSSFYETPNLDRLAAEGMCFTDAYAASPVCSPTRASILTGKYPARVGITQWIGGKSEGILADVPYIHHLPLGEFALAKALRQSGYATWHVGKWHLGESPYYPEQHGFDVNIGGCHWGHPWKGYFSPWGIETLPDGPKGEYLTDRLTDEAITLIRQGAKSGRPFFLNLWYYAVHTPIQAKDAYVQKYVKKAQELGLDRIEPIEEGDFFPFDERRHLRIKRRRVQSDPVYAAMIEILDENIGRLLQTLEEVGVAKNTLVIFTSDNGGLSASGGASPTCNAPLAEGKGWLNEGGVREPLIVRWPDVVPAGSVCHTSVTSPDFYPTILEAAGLPLLPQQHTDGVSFAPLLTGASATRREAIYWHYPHYSNQGCTPGAAMRLGDYKLIYYFEDGSVELFNLRDDIEEARDLAKVEPQRAEDMRKMLELWLQDVGARIPEPRR